MDSGWRMNAGLNLMSRSASSSGLRWVCTALGSCGARAEVTRSRVNRGDLRDSGVRDDIARIDAASAFLVVEGGVDVNVDHDSSISDERQSARVEVGRAYPSAPFSSGSRRRTRAAIRS